MDAKVKELWIEALRSGEFEQGVGQLCFENHYCCLGVLELLACREGVVKQFDGSRAYLSPVVALWAGFRSTETNPIACGESLGRLNDNGNNFATIADRIEKYL